MIYIIKVRVPMRLLLLLSLLSLFITSNAYTNINMYGTGMFLPYSMGIVGYIKKYFPLNDINITGISGGAICSILYTQEDDLSNPDKIWDYTIGQDVSELYLYKDLYIFQKNIGNNLKLRYNNTLPRDLDKISVISTDVSKMKNVKVSNFDNINDLIDFSLCSSYIPYISGDTMGKKYKGGEYMDGEIFRDYKYNKKQTCPTTISIHRKMWGRKFPLNNCIYTNKQISSDLFNYGWEDTQKNQNELFKCITTTKKRIYLGKILSQK
jgi:hypothetical protein